MPRTSIPVTGVILAGGLSVRLSGRNKAFIQVGGERILDRIYRVFSSFFQEIVLVTNDPTSYLEWDLKIVSDLFSERSSLTGIHAGLFHASHPHAFFSACDTPFLRPEMVSAVVEKIRPELDVVIPETAFGLEPLCAVYSQRCLKPIENRLCCGKFNVQGFFRQVRVLKIPKEETCRIDPEGRSFININTPEDLAAVSSAP